LNHCYQDIPGWFDFQDVYTEAVQAAADGDVLVEVGAWLGKSTAFMAVEIANSGKNLHFYVVDTWLGNDDTPATTEPTRRTGKPLRVIFDENMANRGLPGHYTAIQERSVEAARIIPAQIQFVYIDADHRYEHVIADIRAWWPVIRPGGILAGHDLHFPGVAQAVREFTDENAITPEVWSDGRSWLFRKRLRHRPCMAG
jgi:cephalosporin hydroxylase